MEKEYVTLTRSEFKKATVVEKVLEGHMTNKEGAEALGLSTRQVMRLKKRYQNKGGAQALAHGNRGRKPTHTLSKETKEKVIHLYTSKYYHSNSSRFSELLAEHEEINISPSSVRRILVEQGEKQVKQRRPKKTLRPRKPQAGMLWQADATAYAWLEDRAEPFTLHGAIDDASSCVVGAVFRKTECREGYSIVMQQGIQAYGIPLSLYADRHTIFFSPREDLSLEQELAGEPQPLSQFGKALAELNIEHIKARTPQAKGRIERLWQTFQDRLVIELRLIGIKTMEEANQVLPSLLDKHNRRVAVETTQTDTSYTPLDPNLDLDHIFSIREYRKISAGHTLSYKNTLYTFVDPTIRLDAKTVAEVRETLCGTILVWHKGQAKLLKALPKPTQATPKTKPKTNTKKAGSADPHKPAPDHPWKTTSRSNRITKELEFRDLCYSQHNFYAEELCCGS